MNYVVSVSDFRKNMPDYFDLAMAGENVVVNDDKRGIDLVKIVKADKPKFDKNEYLEFIKSIGGSGLLASREDELVRKKFRNDINKRFEEAKKR